MKFLMDYTGEVAVNVEFVKALNIETVSDNEVFLFASVDDYEYEDPNTEDTYEGAIILRKFYADDNDKNFKVAKKYFAELVDKLNSGGKI